MADCIICEMIKGGKLLYEDSKCVAMLSPAAIAPGHLIVLPKAHYTIMEQVPDYEVAHISKIANKMSIALFESMKIQGTNLLIQNGTAAHQSMPHFMIHIVPRMEGDNLNFLWKPKQLSEEEMSTIEMQLKDASKSIGNFEKEKPKPFNLDKKPELFKDDSHKDDKSNKKDLDKEGDSHKKDGTKDKTKEKKDSDKEKTDDSSSRSKGTKVKIIEGNYMLKQLERMP